MVSPGEEPALPRCDVDQPNRAGGYACSGKALRVGPMWLPNGCGPRRRFSSLHQCSVSFHLNIAMRKTSIQVQLEEF
jgi:hypothetical protein